MSEDSEAPDRLSLALRKAFDAVVEHHFTGKFHRFAVISSRFSGMGDLARQDAIWAVVDETLTREEAVQISIILAYAPDEIEVASPI